MFGFIHNGYNLNDASGINMMRSGFGGLYELLQYAPPDVHDIKVDILKTVYDEIEHTLKETWNEKSMMYQAYL